MDIKVNNAKVTEGDIVEVQWSCPEGQNAQISIDNGYKTAIDNVSGQGSKKFKLNRSKGKTVFTITAQENGKTVSKKAAVRVKKLKPIKAKVNRNGFNGSTSASAGKAREKFNLLKSRLKYSWSVIPEKKKLAITVSFILLAVMIVTSFVPKFLFFGMMALLVYLMWVIYKK
ncbi:MAG: hypothetical protein PHD11_06370 [Bacteroidales bacterium]|nr:hypothetical protein [Bacteroidales bacterium]MDD4670782.1 hypothetical protein [Bacteroidales bacterium]